ncbi:box C/D snoRNA protein 1-like [Acanthaster planci]|uniref:Box C/D snoRNA protein 1 n=1 Tax=Acanthaster planci TaxID=133434 RepID=A0A8B7YQ73_ACAPL|nr:box C/D snoRNA protein 1-like [Acanthaster planci]
MSCEICEQVKTKYTCPRCSVKTCSLHCVKRHKASTNCSGVRDKTAYVSVKDFTDRHLLSDYRFLEDVDRKAYSAITDDTPGWHPYKKKFNQLRNLCQSRSTSLKLLPPSFSRHKENTTWVNKRERVINWRVHWKFPQSDAEYIDKSVREDQTLFDILATHLDPVKGDPVHRQRLKRYCHQGFEELRLYMKVEGRPANSLRYHKLDLNAMLRENLSGKCLIEFPVIYVVLKEWADGYEAPEQVQSTSRVAPQESWPQRCSQDPAEWATEDTLPNYGYKRQAKNDTSEDLPAKEVTEMANDTGTGPGYTEDSLTEKDPAEDVWKSST